MSYRFARFVRMMTVVIVGGLGHPGVHSTVHSTAMADMAESRVAAAGQTSEGSTGKTAKAPSVPKNLLKDGFNAIKERDWKSAVEHFEKAQQQKPLSMRALLALAYAYRKVEDCPKAVEPLNLIQKKSKGRKLSKRDAKIARSGLFLLARCYGKQNDAGKALFILNGYLLDPKKYASEIRQSLRLLDFGGLKTQSDFRDYMEAARKALAKIPQPDSFQSFGQEPGNDYEKPADPGASSSGF